MSTIRSLFTALSATVSRTFEASYEIALLVTKSGTNHTVREELLTPSISAFPKTVQEKRSKTMKLCHSVTILLAQELMTWVKILKAT